MQVTSASVPLARTWSHGSSCKKPGKCSLYFGQPCAQNAILEKHGDSVERELAVGHHHLSHETHSLASLPQLEAAGASSRPPHPAFFMLKGIDGAGWARAVGSRLHTPLQLLTVAKALLPE